MKRMISGILVATLVLAASPAWAADSDNPARPAASAAPGAFALSIEHALAGIVTARSEPAAQLQAATHANDTAALHGQALRSAQPVASGKAGGGHAMATVMTLVGVGGGIAGSVYMYKMMKKTTDPTKP
jgi:hypothetical protein